MVLSQCRGLGSGHLQFIASHFLLHHCPHLTLVCLALGARLTHSLELCVPWYTLAGASPTIPVALHLPPPAPPSSSPSPHHHPLHLCSHSTVFTPAASSGPRWKLLSLRSLFLPALSSEEESQATIILCHVPCWPAPPFPMRRYMGLTE